MYCYDADDSELRGPAQALKISRTLINDLLQVYIISEPSISKRIYITSFQMTCMH